MTMEMCGPDVLSAVTHQLAEAETTLTVKESEKWGNLMEKIPYFVRTKGPKWDASSLWSFFEAEIKKGATIIAVDHCRLVTG